MLAFLLGLRTRRAEEITCSLKTDTPTTYPKSGSIGVTCTSGFTLEEGEAIKAKLGGFSTTKDDYTITKTEWNSETTEFELSYTNAAEVYTSVSIAVIPADATEITNHKEVEVTILPDPVVGTLERTASTETIYPNSELTFSVEITKTVISEGAKIKYEIYDSSITEKEAFSTTEGSTHTADLSRMQDSSDKYSFKVPIPQNTEPKDYKLMVQFTDSQNQASNYEKTNNPFTVTAPSVDCQPVDEQTNFAVNSAEVKAKCTINGYSSTTFKAKANDVTENVGDYTRTCQYDTTTKIVTCSFHEDPANTEEANKVSFALMSDDSTILAKKSVDINLIPTPEVSNLVFLEESDTITGGQSYHFKVTITKPTMTSFTGKADYVDSGVEDFTEGTTVTLTRIDQTTEYKFDFTIPEGSGRHNLLFKAFNVLNNPSTAVKKEITIPEPVAPSMECSALETKDFEIASNAVKAKCEITGSDSTTIKAKTDEATESVGDYTRTCEYDADTKIVTCHFDADPANTEEANKVSFALLSNDNTILAKKSVEINLIPTPEASNLDFVSPQQTIEKGQEYQFKVTISKPTLTTPTGKVSYVEGSSETFGEGTTVELTKIDGTNDYSFKFTIPSESQAGTNSLLFKAFNALNQESVPVKKVIEVPQPSGSVTMECSPLPTKDFAATSNVVKAKCIITGSTSTSIKAKTGEEGSTSDNYNRDCTYSSEDHTVTCDFAQNNDEANKVSFALIGEENAILAKSSAELNLIPQIEASDLVFDVEEPQIIYRGDQLHFKVTVTKPTLTSITAKIDFVDQDGADLTANAKPVTLTKTENGYKFDFQVPGDASEATHKLLFKATNLVNQDSTVLSKELVVKIKPSITCQTPENSNLQASGELSLSCTPSDNIKDKTFKYSFDGTNFKDATYADEKVKITYNTEQTEPITKIVVAVFDGDTKLASTSVNVTIFPAPSIKEIADANKGSKYIVGDDITVKITKGTFHLLEEAKVAYGFVAKDTDSLDGGVEAKSAPKKISDTEYQITIKVPDTENTEGSKYLKMKFIDKAGQETTATTKDKIEFYQTVFMVEPNIGSAEQGSGSVSEEPKFKTTDTIRVELTLKNLKSKDNTKFGFKLGNKDGEMHDITSYEIIEESSSQRRLLETTYKAILNITIPKDYEVPENGKTNLHIYTLDENKHIVSAPITKEITLEKANNIEAQQGSTGLTGKQIAGIVVGVIVFIAIVIIIIFFLMRRKASNNNDDDNDPTDSGSGIMV